MGVTAVLQSGTATGSMAAGLATANAGLVPALAVMLGANVGATLVVQVLLFDVAAVSPALILVGALMFRKTSNTRAHHLGRAFIGIGLMLLALHELLDLMTDYEDAPSLRMMLGAATAVPLVDVLLAASLTWAADSNVASVLLIASLGAKNVVPPDTAFALVLGANLGTAIKPMLDWTAFDDAVSKRLPVGNLLIVVAGVALALAALGPIGRFMVIAEPDNGRVVADFHTLFNAVLAAIFLPLLVSYENLLGRLMPALIKFAEPGGLFHGDQAHIASEQDRDGRAMPAGLRLGADPGELLVGACPRLRVSAEPRRAGDRPLGAPIQDATRARTVTDVRERVECDSASSHGALMRYKAAGSIWLALEDMRIVRHVEPVEGARQSVLATYIEGTARLEDGYLCERGKSWTKDRLVSVTFVCREVNDEDYRGLREWQDALGATFSDVPVGTAKLGYNAPDDEMQQPGRWWARVHIPAISMHGLMEGIEAVQLTNVRLALMLKNLYSITPEVADERNDACVFLGPDRIEVTALPEVATGYVTYLSFELAGIKLGPSQ